MPGFSAVQGHAQKHRGAGAVGGEVQRPAQSFGPRSHAGQAVAVAAGLCVETAAVVADFEDQLAIFEAELDFGFRAAGVPQVR